MQGVTATALNVSSSPGPWLAAAQRISKRTVRITVYEFIPDISLASQLHSMPTSQVYQADVTEPLLVKVLSAELIRKSEYTQCCHVGCHNTAERPSNKVWSYRELLGSFKYLLRCWFM